MQDERFTIRDVCEKLGLPADYHRRSVTIECPVCGKKEKKLNINFDKGAFRCAKCGVSGYAVHLWALYRGIPLEDMAAATRDFYADSINLSVEKSSSVRICKQEPMDVPTASIDVRNSTFEKLISILPLSEKHEDALLKRGLSKEVIAENEYRSYPLTGYASIANMLLERGCILEGCPGFYKDSEDRWTLRRLSGGILIPQRDGQGRIQGFQIRTDHEGSSKYLTLSTGENYKCGAKGFANPHFRYGKLGFEEVIITEGPLKGDIISHLTGMSVLALQGVNAVSRLNQILSELEEIGTKKVLTAFDMDLRTNIMVRDALEKLEAKISDAGFSYQQLYWDEQYKGLDDWLYANRNELKWRRGI